MELTKHGILKRRLDYETYMLTPEYEVYFDGTYSKEKNISGWGFVVKFKGKVFHQEHGICEHMDSHKAELTACLNAMGYIKTNLNDKVCLLIGDNQPIIHFLKHGKYKYGKSSKDGFKSLDQISKEVFRTKKSLGKVNTKWVPREKNREANVECRKVRYNE